jgi:hypothetical protein
VFPAGRVDEIGVFTREIGRHFNMRHIERRNDLIELTPTVHADYNTLDSRNRINIGETGLHCCEPVPLAPNTESVPRGVPLLEIRGPARVLHQQQTLKEH